MMQNSNTQIANPVRKVRKTQNLTFLTGNDKRSPSKNLTFLTAYTTQISFPLSEEISGDISPRARRQVRQVLPVPDLMARTVPKPGGADAQP